MIAAMGMPVTMTTKKLSEGHPNVVDVIEDGSVGAVVNTVTEVGSVLQDGYLIRRAPRRAPGALLYVSGHGPGGRGGPADGARQL